MKLSRLLKTSRVVITLLCGFFALAVPGIAVSSEPSDWPSYNRTLSGNRFSSLKQITRANVAHLHKVCSFDLGKRTSFQTGPIVVGATMYVTTAFETIALDAGTCRLKWRRTDTYKAASLLNVNRGAAYLDGRLFRGTLDGRVLTYDAFSGKRLWQQTIGSAKLGETVPAALIAWRDLVFAGNAGGDNKGVKGRMYALDAATGAVRWEFYLVPKSSSDLTRGGAETSPIAADKTEARSWPQSPGVPVTGGASWTSYTLDPVRGELYVPGGNPAPDFVPALRAGSNLFANSVVVLDARTGAYRRHMPLVIADFHDWDVSASPVLLESRAGRHLMATAVKDGHLYINDRVTGAQLQKTEITTSRNVSAPLTAKGTRFCPGTQGGAEWNGPSYAPTTNLIYTGAVDWCTTVRTAPIGKVQAVPNGQPWSGSVGPAAEAFGKFDPVRLATGWIYAHDADTGATVWRFHMTSPVLAATTPTAAGLLFAGDMGGRLVAFDATTGRILWSTKTGGALGGGIITYLAGGSQRVAVASGMVSSIWPTANVTAKIIVYGVTRGSATTAVSVIGGTAQ